MNPYISIIRPSISVMSAIGTVVGALVAGASAPLEIGIAAMVVFLVSAGGLVINDYYDIEIDKINAPHRPLPSGKISKKTAAVYGILLLLLGTVVSYFINVYCFILAAVNSLLEIIYARNLKRIALVGNAADSWFVASTFIFGSFLTMNFRATWILSMLSFLANMGREIFGDIEDLAGDSKLGLKTLPIIAGTKVSLVVGGFFILLAVGLSILPYALGVFGMSYLVPVALADALFIFSLFQTPKKNQRTTKIAMIIALIAFLAGALA